MCTSHGSACPKGDIPCIWIQDTASLSWSLSCFTDYLLIEHRFMGTLKASSPVWGGSVAIYGPSLCRLLITRCLNLCSNLQLSDRVCHEVSPCVLLWYLWYPTPSSSLSLIICLHFMRGAYLSFSGGIFTGYFALSLKFYAVKKLEWNT